MPISFNRLATVGALLTAVYASLAAPAAAPASSLVSAPPVSATVAPASDDPNGLLWTDNSNVIPKPMRGSLGSNILGPQNVPLDLENADLLAPPTTDAGTV